MLWYNTPFNLKMISIHTAVNRWKMCYKPHMFSFRNCHVKFYNNYKCIPQKRLVSTSAQQNTRIPQDETGFEDDINDFEDNYTNLTMYEGSARDLLYKNTKDLLLQRISSCASVQEVFKILETNIKHYDCEHVTQTVFVLYDLMRIYQDFSAANLKNPTKSARDFFENLEENSSFQKLLTLAENKINCFDHHVLSHCVLYLSKLGLSVVTSTMQMLCETLKKMLLEDFSLSSSRRFLEAVFSEASLQPYFISQELVPLVFKEIDVCSTTDSLNNLSVSLNKLYKFVTFETLNKFTTKVETFIENGLLTSSDYKVVLHVISFLHYPRWREKNTVLISKCILLIQNSINELNIEELLLLYEIFFKIQEPGYILNDLQRCSYKYFYQLDSAPTAQKLTLFSTVAYFTAPHVRSELRKKLKNYVIDCEDYDVLLILRKLLSQMKISDIKLCHTYWNKILKILKTESETIDAINLCEHYMNFNTDIDNYRHVEFEDEMFKILDELTKEKYEFYPNKLASILNFTLLYGKDLTVLEQLTAKLEDNWQQLKHSTCLKLSSTLRLFSETNKSYEKLPYARRIDKTLDKFICKKASVNQEDWENYTLLKSCIYKTHGDSNVIHQLMQVYTNPDHICSKNIENVFYCFLMTNILIPEVLDNITDYILKYKNHVLGFNVARVIYLCYCLGYRPKRSEDLCNTAVDIIIRDFERLTGLSILYSALALCFFNKLPNSLVKSIFNVEFMDKLDNELQRCYSKDKYPNRVRNYLMQLNRAVCLDYPECNVPWFHEKYVEETVKGKMKKPTLFATKIKEYLLRIVENKSAFSENVISPYGYEINFVINLNSSDEVSSQESDYKKRLAVLLMPEYAYTNTISQLKGNFQLKRRHLEILGYKVVFVKFTDWISLYYPDERLNFLNNLIFPKKCSQSNIETNR